MIKTDVKFTVAEKLAALWAVGHDFARDGKAYATLPAIEGSFRFYLKVGSGFEIDLTQPNGQLITLGWQGTEVPSDEVALLVCRLLKGEEVDLPVEFTTHRVSAYA